MNTADSITSKSGKSHEINHSVRGDNEKVIDECADGVSLFENDQKFGENALEQICRDVVLAIPQYM